MIIPRSLTWAAGTNYDLNAETNVTSGALRFLKFTALPASSRVEIYVKFNDGNKSAWFPVVVGDVYEFETEVSALYMKTDTAGVTEWQSSLTDRMRTGGNSNVVIVGPVAVTGNVNNTPVGPDLMSDAGGLLYPLATRDGLNLGVGGILTVIGYIGNNAEIDTTQVSFLRLVTQNAGATGDFVTALDMNSLSTPPLPILDVNGNLARADGRLYFDATFSPAGTTYYIDVRGVQRVVLSPGVGAPAFKTYAAPMDSVPFPKGKRRVILSATDLGITVGAYASAAADILTTASIKSKLTAVGFTPSKLELMISLTPGGSGADTFFLEYKKTLAGVASQRLSINTYVSTTTGLATCFVSYNSGQNMGQAFGLNGAAAGVAPAAAGNMVIPFDDVSFILRKSTATNVGVINNISLLLEE